MSERDYYEPVKSALEATLKNRFNEPHLEITAAKKFSNKLKARVEQYREIIFHFLRDAAPDIVGFVIGEYSIVYFVVAEVKNRVVKLADISQARIYADLFGAKYAVLVSTEETPEEIKRLYRAASSLFSLPGYGTLAIARFDEKTESLVDWFPRNPFEEAR